MSRQNVYDEAEFFAGYSQMRARRTGLHERVVDGVLRRLLPDLAEKRVVDLGCGDGWACRVALELAHCGHAARFAAEDCSSLRSSSASGSRPATVARAFRQPARWRGLPLCRVERSLAPGPSATGRVRGRPPPRRASSSWQPPRAEAVGMRPSTSGRAHDDAKVHDVVRLNGGTGRRREQGGTGTCEYQVAVMIEGS